MYKRQLVQLGVFTENMISGRGYIALATVILGRYTPFGMFEMCIRYSPEAVRLFQQLRDIGVSCCLVSNNRKKRVEPFAASVGAQFIEMAAKPSRKGYERAMERLGTNTGNTVFIGDQLFTDIWGAKNAGLRNILVKPINPKEEIQIVLKRYLEKIVLHFYTKEEKNS